MSTEIPSRQATELGRRDSPWAGGLTVFAAAVMVVAGTWHALAGIAALVNDEVYVAAPRYIYAFDLTAWGWTHLILGLAVVAAGVAVVLGETWARVVGIVLTSLSLIANFLFLPHYPLWSLLIIALDIAVIWALATYRLDLA
jgi:hypothetical protein